MSIPLNFCLSLGQPSPTWGKKQQRIYILELLLLESAEQTVKLGGEPDSLSQVRLMAEYSKTTVLRDLLEEIKRMPEEPQTH